MRFLSFPKSAWCLLFVVFSLVAQSSLASASPVRINPQLAPGETINDFKVSPNGAYAVYRVNREVLVEDPEYPYYTTVSELYSVNVATGASRKLNGVLPQGGQVTAYKISPDSRRVVYIADQSTDNNLEIYSVAISGTTPATRLNSACPASAITCAVNEEFQISPDSRFVVFVINTEVGENYNYNIYSAAIAGGSTRTLTQGLPAGTLFDFKISPDSSRVVYVYENRQTEQEKLYSVGVAGGTPRFLSNTNRILAHDIVFTPDSDTVVFRNDPDGVGSEFEPQLYSVPLAGGSVIRLSLETEAVGNFRVSNHFDAVIYTTRLANQTVSFTGVLANGSYRYTIPTELRAQEDSFVIAGNDQAIVFMVTRSNGFASVNDLYSISLASRGVPVRLSPAQFPQNSLGLMNFKVSPDGSRVVFVAASRGAYLYELFSAPVAGGSIIQLNNPFDNSDPFAFSSIADYQISADSQRVVFGSEPYDDSFSNLSLFSNSTAGGTARFIGYGSGYDFAVAPNSRSVIFLNGSYDYETYTYVGNLFKAVFP